MDIRTGLNTAAAGTSEKNTFSLSSAETFDLVIANPPYVGPQDYELGGKTEQSVRDHEPKEALVPVASGHLKSTSTLQSDLFYWPIYRIAQAVDAKLLLMEVGDSAQASRVSKILAQNHSYQPDLEHHRARIESWRDDGSVRVLPTRLTPSIDTQWEESTDPDISDRAVLVWSEQLADWRRQNLPAEDAALDKITDPGEENPTYYRKEAHSWRRSSSQSLKTHVRPKSRKALFAELLEEMTRGRSKIALESTSMQEAVKAARNVASLADKVYTGTASRPTAKNLKAPQIKGNGQEER